MRGELVFGTAGVPHSSSQPDTLSGLRRVKELGLGVLELEFVRGVHLKPDTATEIRRLKDNLNLRLTCHAPYFINLASIERAKVEASIKRILDSARIASRCGAESVTFHAGFYMKQQPEHVYRTIKKTLIQLSDTVKQEGLDIALKPELTGKPSQFGSLEELLRLATEIKGLGLCIDFSHLHARNRGQYNSYPEFMAVFQLVQKILGKQALQDLHIHVSGIKYTDKGEREHLNLTQSDFNYRDLLKALKETRAGGIIISESPNLEKDALLMQEYYFEV